MGNESKDRMGAVNASGYPLHLRIAEEIRASPAGNQWTVIGEHRWVDRETGENGFIDLILRNGNLRAIVECKRKDADWVFLYPDGTKESSRAYAYWYHNQDNDEPLRGWDEFPFKKVFPQPAFCVSSPKDSLTLEKVASELLRSIECLAQEESGLDSSVSRRPYLYIPVIATTASLYLCQFATQKIDLKDGRLKDGSEEITEVPFVAFRKDLSTRPFFESYETLMRKWRHEPDLELLNKKRVQTVFVVNTLHLTKFLEDLAIMAIPDSVRWP